MNKKSKELEIKLNNSKIISDDVRRGQNVMNFFDKKQQKQDDLKLFSDEFQKVQI
jgi:hypothetical protein